jgi:predicted TIM-barrel fold metal-dependent hydrolase
MGTEFDIFDCHQHMGSTADAHGGGVAGQVKGGAVNDDEVRCRLEFMDRAAIRQAVAIPGHNYNRSDGIAATRRENDVIAAYRDRNPDRFPVAAGIIEPLDEAAGLAEIDRIAGELGLRAVSFHTEYQSVTIDSPWMLRYLERMGELGLVPLVHASNVVLHEALWRLGKVARAIPDLTIVAIEPFFTHDGMEESFFIADVAPNVIFETASCFDTDILLSFIDRFGAERVIFGSQYYSRIVPPGQTSAHQRRCLALVRDIVETPMLTDDGKQRILGSNARALFGLGDAPAS